MKVPTLEEIGENAYHGLGFDPYNSADTSAKWLVARWVIGQSEKWLVRGMTRLFRQREGCAPEAVIFDPEYTLPQ